MKVDIVLYCMFLFSFLAWTGLHNHSSLLTMCGVSAENVGAKCHNYIRSSYKNSAYYSHYTAKAKQNNDDDKLSRFLEFDLFYCFQIYGGQFARIPIC